jgi:hypothetical protein
MSCIYFKKICRYIRTTRQNKNFILKIMTILEFWQLDQKKYTKENIKEMFQETYENEFIDNYEKWSNIIKESNDFVNDFIVGNINENFNKKNQFIIEYDFFIHELFNKSFKCIDQNNEITAVDITTIINDIMLDAAEKSNEMYKKNTYNISSLLQSIKTFNVK